MSSCSSFTDVGFAKFSVISFCGNGVFKVNKVCYHFADEVLSCFAYAVIIVKTVVLKIPNGWAVKVTDAPAINRFPCFVLFGSLTSHPFYPRLVLNTSTQLILQPREYRQRKDNYNICLFTAGCTNYIKPYNNWIFFTLFCPTTTLVFLALVRLLHCGSVIADDLTVPPEVVQLHQRGSV